MTSAVPGAEAVPGLPAGLDVLGVDHVGIAVAEIEPAVALWTGALGFVEEHRERNEEQGVVEVMLGAGAEGDLGSQTRLQLLAPLSPSSPVARFLHRRGPGLQHLALSVPDVVIAADVLRTAGLELLYPGPRSGTAQSKINFLHPRHTGGVLVEVVQVGSNPPKHDRSLGTVSAAEQGGIDQ